VAGVSWPLRAVCVQGRRTGETLLGSEVGEEKRGLVKESCRTLESWEVKGTWPAENMVAEVKAEGS